MLAGETGIEICWWNGDVPGIAGISGQCFLDALLDGFDGEMAADRSPAAGPERFEYDVGVSEYPDFLHTVRTSQLERRGEVVLSKELGQTAQPQTRGFGGLPRRQPSILKNLVQHAHEGK